MVMAFRPPKELYPFESRYLDVGGARLHYIDEGSGDPVVMLHGNPTWSFMYRNLALALSGAHRVIAPDHVGCGLSDKPADDRYDYSLRRRVDDLDRLLESLDATRNVTLVLHDWGGMIGMAWASRRPEAVKRLVLMNTAAFRLPESKAFPPALRLCRDSKFGAYLVRRFNAFSLGASYVGAKRGLSSEIRRAYTGPYDSWANRIATLRFVQDIPLHPGDRSYELVRQVDEGLGRFKTLPTLLLWGLKDFVFDRHFLDEWRRRFPSAELHAFPDAGHYVLEDAGDRILPLVRAFLEQTPSQAAGRP
jgi:cis-3-alkyl-4-acyloxetan-2-one decarboxylase